MLRTRILTGCVLTGLAVAGSYTTVYAQAKSDSAGAKAPPIDAAAAGVTRLYEDLDYVFGLAKEPAALKTLKETLDVYFEGVDPKIPAVFQIYVRKGKFNTVMHVAAPKPQVFRNNIRTLGVKSSNLGTGMYQLKGLFPGFLKESGGISIIAEDRADATPIPGGLIKHKATLAAKDYDFVARVINTAALLQDREKAIEEVRKQVMPGLKKLKNETDTQFELRKLTLDQEISELKQIYAEAETIKSFTDLVPANKKLVSETELTALAKTPLSDIIDSLAKEPSYFANIPLSDKEPLSSSINLKLDAMRQKHLKNFLAQARPLIQKEIKESETNSAKTKEYTSISTDIVFDVLEKGADDGLLDSIINVHANASGLHTMVGGTRVDGAVVKAGLEKLKAVTKVEMDAGKVGDVDLHKVTLPADLTELHKIYGKDLVLILGTSPKAIWYAMGENAEAKLKESIEKAAQPAPAANNTVVFVHAKALLWYELFDAHRTKHKKGDAADRQMVIDALKEGDDIFDFKMEKVGEGLKTLKLTLNLQEGMLRYFGKAAAKFVKENLES